MLKVVDNIVEKYVCPLGHVHSGAIIDGNDDYKALACDVCGFVHAIPIPTNDELAGFYARKFYESERKSDYIESQAAQKEWWDSVFGERLSMFERLLGRKGRVLDLGCGPGFFLAYARDAGWDVVGVEPSEKASSFACENLGLNVLNKGFEGLSVAELGHFDLVYSHGVIEHLQSPRAFVRTSRNLLKEGGLLFVNCANDFNPFQKALRETQDYPAWWFVPPEHINYFTVGSLSNFLEKEGFVVEERSTSFPIDIFLLMGDNYVADPALGKPAHARRTAFEAVLEQAGMGELRNKLYKAFADLDLGRQIDLVARKQA